MFSEIALKILEKRYYLRDKDGNLLEKSPEDLFRRVARSISQAELNYSSKDQVVEIEELFYNAMINQELMPASPILFNAGTPEPMLSSCFGIEVEDSMESILKVLSDSAMIFKKGGGVGWNFSKLRGKGSALSGGGTSSGVCAFIQLYDTMIEAIKQGGKRRGAGAVILDSMHHDILEFIGAKRDGIWSNLNISVICTDEFMSKIDTDYKEIWNEIVKSSWSAGDPNLIFIDSMNRNNSLPKYPINVVNPCHEICMSSYESCNLAGINLDKCLKGNKKNAKIDWDKLGRLVKLGHRFLDNMIDVCKYPLQEIHDFAHKTRRQGLYVFGLAPLLIRLGLRYGSQESLDLIDNLFCFINRVSLESCISLGKERGNFPEFAESTYSKKYKYMRCSNRLTIAPSGTT
jgi:ribonucleoside-diphosphate reductase alpha chain